MMWGRGGGRAGRHTTASSNDRPPAERESRPDPVPAAPRCVRDPSATRTGARAGDPHTEPIAIIGGSAITLLAGRIRRPHTIADVESPTGEVALTLPGPRGARTGAARRRAAADAPRSRRQAAGSARAGTRRRRAGMLAVATGGLVGAAVVGIVVGVGSTPSAEQPAVPVPATAVPATAAPAPATAAPAPERVRAYLVALRSADIPASRSGIPETEAAAAICEQSRRGVPGAELARALPAMLSKVDRRQAPTVVDLAKRYYCP